MSEITRRNFIGQAAAGTAGLAGILASRTPPAFAQKREVTMLDWSHFVPASDAKLKGSSSRSPGRRRTPPFARTTSLTRSSPRSRPPSSRPGPATTS